MIVAKVMVARWDPGNDRGRRTGHPISPYFDIDAGQSFIQRWHQLKAGPRKASTEAILKLTEDIRELFKFSDLEINAAADLQTLQVIIGGKSYRLPEIGSGLAQFMPTFGSTANRQSSYILLDEPELNLHPSLQLAFVTTVASYAPEELCFATHTIGLARAAAELVYTVRRFDDGSSEVLPVEAQTSLAEFLGELGFVGYREMGFDQILLVEGPKDLKAVHQLLRMYGKDDQVLLLPLGGSSGINADAGPQLVELRRVSAKISALIDSEKAAAAAQLDSHRAAFQAVCLKPGVGINCKVLDRRAIENYLPQLAIQAVKGPKYLALKPYEKLTDADPAWSKEENSRIAREMKKEDLDGTDWASFFNHYRRVEFPRLEMNILMGQVS